MHFKIAQKTVSAPVQFKEQVADIFSMPEELADLLYYRGVTTSVEVREFLFPKLASLPDPTTMLGMERAVSLIIKACKEGLPLLIHGDYDVDGISGTALLLEFLREMGGDTHYYIPNRLNESYGLSAKSIDKLTSKINRQKGLVITVDCGISSYAEVEYLKENGHKVIVTDHHEPPSRLPNADAVLNPKQPGCDFGFPWLSGVGVAFYLIIGLRSRLVQEGTWHAGGAPNLKNYLDLVALGTVADIMPLVGLNRILVKAGLEVLSQKQRPGILALCECSGLGEGKVQTDDIAFKLAPRINASGRLGKPEQGVALFTAKSLAQAREQATLLDQYNTNRKQLERDVLPDVYAQCEEQVSKGMRALAIYEKGCHPGVLGIVASRIAERFLMPAIIFTLDNGSAETIKGSGRSAGNVNLYEVLTRCRECIDQFGGHAKAVGLSLQHEKLDEFRQVFSEAVGQHPSDTQEEAMELAWDVPVQKLFNKNFIMALQALQPFGEDNPEPIFFLEDQQLEKVSTVKGHLKFSIRVKGRFLSGIGFNLADCATKLDRPVGLFCRVKRTFFRGVERDEIQAVHIV